MHIYLLKGGNKLRKITKLKSSVRAIRFMNAITGGITHLPLNYLAMLFFVVLKGVQIIL